ncbi:GNAT family N-acetyltransferase [Streptomyces misionensis]|uniref:GNAT family N-acetyltransferase n=1 Tax=Streptomyces misionensis TaxID=67331 RepID=A0A5C6IU93_9ACTN|nr:GNAT family N-acetyltransferase [Streptomyces misionensis]TWV32584.1 GNAT family N-acetyltransferase [Streptomyces misionensis]
MTGISVLGDTTAWRRDFEGRRRARYLAAGLGEAAAEELLGKERAGLDDWTVAEVTAAGSRMGHVAVSVSEADGIPTGRIGDLHVEAGHERAALEWAHTWCAERGARRVDARLAGPAGELFAGYALRGQVRVRRVGAPPEAVDGVTARPMTRAEYPGWLASEQASYIDGIVRSGTMSRERARRKSDDDFGTLLPEGLATPGNTLLVLEAAGEPIGTGWLRHGHLPGVTYGYSLHVFEAHRGKGYGRAAMAAGERATLAAGDSVLMFSVWGGNEVAMNLYTSAGYQVLDEARSIDLPD